MVELEQNLAQQQFAARAKALGVLAPGLARISTAGTCQVPRVWCGN